MAFILDQVTPPLIILSLGVLPSLIWLAFYLRKDAHPEPKHMIIRVFLLGMAVTVPVIFAEQFAKEIFQNFGLPPAFFWVLYFLVGVAFVEEFAKYLAASIGSFSDPELDEPVDVMIYMIIAALGFAAAENILLFFSYLATSTPVIFSDLIWLTGFRFLGAVFLHVIASALFGYFIALGMFVHKRHKFLLFAVGLFAATILHWLFNFYILNVGNEVSNFLGTQSGTSAERFVIVSYLLFPTILLIGLSFYVARCFQILKKHNPA